MCDSKEDIPLSHTVHILFTWRGRDLASLYGIFTCCCVMRNFYKNPTCLLYKYLWESEQLCRSSWHCFWSSDRTQTPAWCAKDFPPRLLRPWNTVRTWERKAFSRLLYLFFYIAYRLFWITVYRLSIDLRKYVFFSYSHNPALPLSHNKPCPAPARKNMHIRDSCNVDNCKKQHKDW